MDCPDHLGQSVTGDVMRPLAIGVSLAGLIGATVIFLAHPDAPTPGASTEEEVIAAAPDTSAAQSGISAAPQAARAPPHIQVRPASPDLVTIPIISPQELERIEPPKEAQAAQAGPAEQKPTLLHRPVATSSGEFTSRDMTVRLAGIVPVGAEEECEIDGKKWPCGVHARTAFRNWLRGRALSCVLPSESSETTVAECQLGKLNPAEWLVGLGWARAEAGGPYADLEEEARKQKRGIFGPAPSIPALPAATLQPQAPEPSGN